MVQKFNLKWNDFQENIITSFASLRGESNFSDVTLACADGEQVKAHKMVLVSTSPFFQGILKTNSHPHPMIFMKGVTSVIMSAVVDFLYLGEVNILQENLDDFLALAEDLKLKGLQKRNHFDDGSKVRSPTSDPKSKTDQSHTLGTFPLVATDTYDEEQRAPDAISSGKGASSQKSQPNPDFTIEASQYYEKVQSMMDKSEKTYLNGARRAFYKICKVCGKEGTGTNIKGHIETNHLQGVLIPCNLCDENFASRNSLKLHKSRNHSTTYASKVESFVEETFKAYMQKTCDVAEKAILAKINLRKKCVNRNKM